jgi:hypothetical protein
MDFKAILEGKLKALDDHKSPHAPSKTTHTLSLDTFNYDFIELKSMYFPLKISPKKAYVKKVAPSSHLQQNELKKPKAVIKTDIILELKSLNSLDLTHIKLLNLTVRDNKIYFLDLKSQFRALAKKHHPDTNPGMNGDTFIAINEAYKAMLKTFKTDGKTITVNGGSEYDVE